MLGYTPEEVMQLTVIDILTPEELERLPSQLTTLSSGGVITNEWQFRRKDGSTFPGELVGRQLPDGSLLGMLRDITERKLAEEALRKGEQRVRDIVESLHDGFFSLDRSFRLTYVNQQAATNLGMTKEQMIGGIIWDVFPNIVGTIQETEYRSAMTGHQPHIFELKGVLTPYEYEIRCYPTADGIAVFIINITERKKVEEKLQESEQRLKYHFENSPLAVVEWDADYFVTQWSKEAENIFGWKKEETLGKRIDTLNMIYTDDIPIVNRTMERLSGGKETMVVSSNRNYTKSGAVIVCVWYNSILLDEKGEMKSVMSLVQDITERKVAEEQLEKNAFELTELNATKDKFFSIIAHDLRNPFTSLLGVSDLMMENAEKFDEERVRKSATLINSSARKAYTLLENLLEWSRSQSGNIKIKPEPFKLCEHVEGIISALSVNADNKEINLNSEIEKEFQVVTDKNITHTIIRNLVSNAIKFTHKGGSVTVNAIKNERHVTVSIKDTGIGMSKDDIEKLFRIDVKYTKAGTNKETGTGLGLILCKEFVEKLGGRIWVESEPGKGSEFKFTIPTVNS